MRPSRKRFFRGAKGDIGELLRFAIQSDQLSLFKWRLAMRSLVKQVLLCSVLFIGLASGFLQKPLAAQLTENDRKLFDWYDGLEIHQFTKQQRLVEVDTGWWSQSGDEETLLSRSERRHYSSSAPSL